MVRLQEAEPRKDMPPTDTEISPELSAISRIIRTALWWPQEHNIELRRQVREHVDGPYDVLHEGDAVACIVILVAADAFHEHLDMRPRNHHLLNLGQLWQMARDNTRVHIIICGHQEGRDGLSAVVCIP
jgi:hypothetical protein